MCEVTCCMYERQKLLGVMNQNGIYIDNPDDVHEVLNIDSITFVTLVIDIEQEFSIMFNDDDYETFADKDEITVLLFEKVILEKMANS